jgi:peptidoglycan/LPS O-acetylase OafA/YrhL
LCKSAALRFIAAVGYFSVPMIRNAPNAASQKQARFPIIDALRIVLAFWVATGHFGMIPVFGDVDTASRFGRVLVHAWSSIVFGIAAVIGFFVISGFCIHLPFRGVRPLPLGHYYARRYIRILVPVVAAILIMRLAGDHQPIGGKRSILWDSVLWSLFCEEIYYAVYPFARLVRNRFGWAVLIAPAFLIGSVLAILRPDGLDGSVLGTVVFAAILFPVWLLGCVLAEQSEHLPPLDSRVSIWGWRFLAWLGSWSCGILHFRANIPLSPELLCFGVLAYFWIRKEIAFGWHHRPWAWLASAGLWSYSLYLIHIPAMRLFSKLSLPRFGHFLDWLISFAFVLALSYLFYLGVERPSHRLARKFTVTPGSSAGAPAATL